MRIELRIAGNRARRWQSHLAERLAARPGIVLHVSTRASADPWPASAGLLLRLEALLFRTQKDGAAEPVGNDAFLAFAAEIDNPDLVIDLVGSEPAMTGRVLWLACDGGPFEPGLLAAVLDGRAPRIETRYRDADGERTLSRWQPAAEVPHHAGAALGMLYGRAAEMILQAVGLLQNSVPRGLPPVPESAAARRGPAAFLAASLAHRIETRLQRLLRKAPNWYVASRKRSGDGIPAISPVGFQRLPDDGARFYADPVLWSEGGRTFLFVEEFPFATSRGLISVSEIASDGSIATPRPVLEADCHLSYPFVFAHGGAVWMIPETSGRRTVELYRADPFPDSWTLHSVLLDNVDLGDATIERIGDRWWMFAASRERWTSSWDALSLYHAESPFGPWRPHAANPVLVDLHQARSAGRMMPIDGRWVRPVQDSSRGYGSALGFAEIRELTETDYSQRTVVRALPWGRNTGLHSFDRSAGFEVIDLYGPRS